MRWPVMILLARAAPCCGSRRERAIWNPSPRAWLIRDTAALAAAGLASRAADTARRLPIVAREWRTAVRATRRQLFVTAAASTMLAVGLGASVTAWALREAVANRPVSAEHGTALRRVVALDRDDQSRYTFSHVEVETLRRHLPDDGPALAAVNLQPALLRQGARVWHVLAEVTSGGYATLVGTEAALGRLLLRSDGEPGAAPVAVLSERFWRDRLAASPGILGQPLTLNTTVVTVVGVARGTGSSSLLGGSVDAWIPEAHGDAVLNPGWRT